MDLTQIVDVVEDAVFEEARDRRLLPHRGRGRGAGRGSRLLLQAGPQSLPKEIEDGLKKSDVIWVGTEANGRDRAVPVWFAYRQGRIYLLHCSDPEAEGNRSRVARRPQSSWW